MIHLALIWHMHQPWYLAPAGATLELPWVRLHGTKDYLEMALRLEAASGMRATFNLVPSLLAQIDAYGGGASDLHRDLSLRDPASLTSEETATVLRHFFPAPGTTLDRPFESYRRLRAKRDALGATMGGPELASHFTPAEILDIVVFWNLVWIDPMFRDAPEVRDIAARGGGFTFEDRDRVLRYHGDLLRRIVPLYRRLEEKGSAELTTSPYYHPILPLLCDTESARPGLPGAPLPSHRFRAPDDARRHVALAVADHERRFGRRPRGVWPSEGSVSDETATILAEAGFRWMASDEDILRLSLSDGGAEWRRRLCQPFRLETGSGPISILFRDKQLSDLVGFVYMRWSPAAAAADFVDRVKAAGRAAVTEGTPLVTVILDGENCWEYYEKDGGPFLDELYARLAGDPEIVVTTPEAFLAEHEPRAMLRGLFPGSWIDHSFHMWIGEPAKNQAWDLLALAREAFEDAARNGEGDIERARSLLDAAEGSDWFWWYVSSSQGPPQPAFDAIFRLYVKEIFRALGRTPPQETFEPIAGRVPAAQPAEAAPVGLIRPVIDGIVTTFYEWTHGGHARGRGTGASMARSTLYVNDLYYGFDLSTLFCRVDLTERGREEADALTVIFEFLAPQPLRIVVPLASARIAGPARIEQGDGSAGECGRACFRRILEIAVPFADLGLASGQEISLLCHAARDGRIVESFPPLGQVIFRAPTQDFEESMWSA